MLKWKIWRAKIYGFCSTGITFNDGACGWRSYIDFFTALKSGAEC